MTVMWILMVLTMVSHMARSECVSRNELAEDVRVHTNKAVHELTVEVAKLKREIAQISYIHQNKRSVNTDEYVAFTAFLSKPGLEHLGFGQTIMFDSVLTNVGNAFDHRLSVFTARTNGVYVFALTMMSRPNTLQQLNVVRNGNEVFHAYSNGNEFNTASKTVVMELNAGDEVWVTAISDIHYSHTLHGYNHTSFSGWLQYSYEQ